MIVQHLPCVYDIRQRSRQQICLHHDCSDAAERIVLLLNKVDRMPKGRKEEVKRHGQAYNFLEPRSGPGHVVVVDKDKSLHPAFPFVALVLWPERLVSSLLAHLMPCLDE